jgi:hypothetical protein
MIKYMLGAQKKLTAFSLASALLLVGLWIPCSNEKYSAFSLALAGMAGSLMAAHAFQKTKGEPEPKE